MDRAIPEINRLTAARVRQESKYKHKDVLKHIKGRVDNSLPESMYHPIVKHKKEQMIEGKWVTDDMESAQVHGMDGGTDDLKSQS